MQHLHAYWRVEYVETPKKNKNPRIFKEIAESSDDSEHLVVHRSALSYIVMNLFPYNAGHLLVVPLREVPELAHLTRDEKLDFMNMVIKAQDILQKALNPDGFNIGFNLGSSAGAGVPSHLHCHVVPRWNADTNFMPVLANTRVIHQSMQSMWKRLRDCV